MGATCTLCKAVENYRGNASNFCYCELINNVKLSSIHNVSIIYIFVFSDTLSVGFIYTFLSPDFETQNLFVARPRQVSIIFTVEYHIKVTVVPNPITYCSTHQQLVLS